MTSFTLSVNCLKTANNFFVFGKIGTLGDMDTRNILDITVKLHRFSGDIGNFFHEMDQFYQ